MYAGWFIRLDVGIAELFSDAKFMRMKIVFITNLWHYWYKKISYKDKDNVDTNIIIVKKILKKSFYINIYIDILMIL